MIFLLPIALVLAVLFFRRKMTLQELADQIAAQAGIDPAMLKAVVRLESAWKTGAENNTGGDALRGGAWGLGQVTLRTAQAYFPSITTAQLLQPDLNLQIAAKVLREGLDKSPNADPADAFAYYNSGKLLDRAPEVTRYKYVPLALKYLAEYRESA
jgi:soluble lytic murein transglycosylase-like protein